MQTGTNVDAGSPSLGEEIGQMLGDLRSTDDEMPSAESGSGAGDTPEPKTDAPASETETDVPDGTDAAERAGDTPAAAATTAEATPAVADDPFKDATPATYTVDGQTRTFDKIHVFGADGAAIKAADLPDVLKRLGERDHLFEQNQKQHRATQTLESLATWKTTTPDGKDISYTGQHGIVERSVAYARAEATIGVLDAILSDPAQFARLVAVNEQNQIVIDPTALDYLKKDVLLAAGTAEQKTRGEFARQIVEAAKPEPQAVDYGREAPGLIAAVASAASLDAAVLTDKDKALLAEQLEFHVRDGKASVAWQNLVKDRIALRQESAKAATAATSAASANAAKLAAAARGKPAPKPAARPARPQEQTERAQSEGDTWDAFERNAARAIRSRS